LCSPEECSSILSLIEDYRASRPPLDPSIILDPFSHCFIRHRTFVYPDPQTLSDHAMESSGTSSWKSTTLPTPVRIMDGTVRAGYLSYINGMDQDFPMLYAALQSTLGRCIALFERTLTSLHRGNPLPQRIRGTYRYRVWDEPDPPEDSDEDAWQSHERNHRQWSLYRPIEIPDIPDEGYREGSLGLGHEIELEAGKEIQVVHRISYLDVVSSGNEF
jgi:hypothetical protein